MKTTAMTTTQLQETGLGDAQIRKLVAHGQLRRLRRGVYLPARGDDAVGQHQELIAATLGAVDATNVVSHTSAAVLHGLPVRSASLARVTMTRTTAGHMKRGAHLLVRDTSIEAGEITELDGIRVTTLARTVADVARTEPLIWGVAAADAAMAQGFQPAQLAQVVAAHPRLHGTRRARSVGKFATPFSESPAESISRVHMLQAGLPMPKQQAEIYDEHGVLVARVDFLWEDYGLIGEVDGAVKYGRLLPAGQTAQQAVLAEKEREGKLRRLGYWIARWDWDTALNRAKLADVVGSGLATAPGRVNRGFVAVPQG